MWHCPKCGEDHEDIFDACWNCGTEKSDQAPEHLELEHEAPVAPGSDSMPLDLHLVARGRAILLVLIGTSVISDLIG